MVELFKSEYWSKSEAFLLPLTGLTKTQKYQIDTYLFWKDYSIENYNLILKITHDNEAEFLKYARKVIFPVLDKSGYLIETHDVSDGTILILDISVWALDIEMFMQGKYSKFSSEAKNMIMEFHTYYVKGDAKIKIQISSALYPFDTFPVLDDMIAIEYVAKYYGLDLVELKKYGEIGGIYNKKNETYETA